MNTKFRDLVVRTFCILVCMLFLDYFILPVPFTFGGDLPTGIQDQIGSSTVTVEGDVMTHTTQDAKYWGDVKSFDIGANKTLNSIGPNSSAVMLYNVTGDAGSTIAGIWNSNCNQFLLNPNGILFTETARLNMGSLVASTLTMSKEDFLSGKYVLSGADLVTLGNNIINKGTITTTGAGGVTFASGAIKNAGTIRANLGTVNLVAGKEVTLNIAGDGSIQAAVSKKLLDNVYDSDGHRVAVGVDNVGEITADGGEIRMEVGAVQDVFDTLINQEGVVRAGSMVKKDGKIVLVSDDKGIIQNTGTMTTSAIEDGAGGGSIEMRGSKVGQFGEVHADARGNGNGGSIMLYANDTVALSSGSITTANAEVDGSGGDITVYSPDTALFWSGAKIEAKGGSAFGDGGFVEVSGKKHVEIYGSVSTLAPNGDVGTFLIDPTNVSITGADTAGAWSNVNTGTWTPSGTGSVADVDTALANGDVIVTTNYNTAGELGDITVSSAVTASANAYSLTLQAANDIILTAGIDMSAGSGNLTLTADWGGGDVASDNLGAITGSGVITMGTGDLAMSAGDGIGTSGTPIATVGLTDVAATTVTGGIYITNSTSGDINVTTVGSTVGLSTTVNGGDISLVNTGGNITLSQAVITDGTAADGNISINAGTGTLDTNDQTVSAGTGNITLTADTIDLGTTVDTIVTTGAVTLAPYTATTTIGIGGGAGTFNLIDTELAAIKNGASSITIGHATGSGLVTIDAVTFYDPVTIRTPSGSITVDGQITGSDNASITLDGSGATTTLNADIVTSGNAITISDSVVVGSPATVTLDTTNSGGVPVGNNISIAGTVEDDANASAFVLNGGTSGTVGITGNAGGTTALASFTVSNAAQVDLADVTTTGAQAVTGTNIDLNGTTYTSSAGAITFTGAVDLDAGAATTTVTGGAAAGDDITFTSTIDDAANDTTLQLAGGASGDIVISGAIGGTSAVAALDFDAYDISVANIGTSANAGVSGATDINAANQLTFTGTTYNANAQNYTAVAGNNFLVNAGAPTTFSSSADNITFNTGTILLADGSDLIINTSTGIGNISTGAIRGTSSEDVTFSAGTGNVYVVGAIGSGNEINTINLESSTSIHLYDNIITSNTLGNTVTLTGPTIIENSITIDTSAGNGDITFNGTVNGINAYTETLGLTAGAGDIDFDGVVGGTTALGAVTINSANNVTADAAFTAASITQTAGTGATWFKGAVDTTGAADTAGGAIAITTTGNIDFDSTITTTGGTAGAGVAGQNGGAVTLISTAGAIDIDNTITTTGSAAAASSDLAGGAGGAVTITANAGNVNVDAITTSGGAGDGAGNGGAAGAIALTSTSNTTTLEDNITAVGGAGGATGTQGAGGAITSNSATVLGTNIAITTGATAGTITFGSTLDGTTAHNETLSLTAGTGNIDFNGIVGGSTALGAVTIASAADVVADAAFAAASITQTAGTGDTTFNGAIDTSGLTNAAGGAVDITADGALTFSSIDTSGGLIDTDDTAGAAGGAVTLHSDTAGPIFVNGLINTSGSAGNDTTDDAIGQAGGAGGAVSITADSGSVTVAGITSSGGAADGVGSDDTANGGAAGAISITSTGSTTTLNGDITAIGGALAGAGTQGAGGAVTLNNAAALGADVAIDTGATAGLITFSSTLNGDYLLTLTAGTGNITFTGAVGAVTPLSGLSITSAGTVDVDSTLTADDQGIDITSSGVIGLDNAITTTNGGTVTITNGGTLTIVSAADMTLTGAFLQNGAGAVSTAGDITTTNDNIRFDSAVTLTDAVALNTGTGIGTITFGSTLNGTTAHAETLGLTAGAGDIDFDGVVGGTTALGAVTINSANDVTADAAFNAASITQTAGTGAATFTGAVDTSGADDTAGGLINITTDGAITFGSTVDTSGGTIATDDTSGVAGGALTLHSDVAGAITVSGAITTSGSAGKDTLSDTAGIDGGAGGAVSITADNGNVNLAAVTTSGGAAAGTAGDGGAAGAITVTSTGNTTLNGNLTAVGGALAGTGSQGAGGAVSFANATNVIIGADVTISTGATAGNIIFSNAGANSLSGGFGLTLTAGTGTVQFDNISDLTSLTVSSSDTTQFVGSTNMAGAISVAATTLIDVDGTTVTTGGVTLDSATNVDIDGAITASGNVDIDADNNVTIDNNITTDGNYTITITADSGTADNAGDLNIAQASASTIQSATGSITLEGENILLGAAGIKGVVKSTGSGNIKVTANREGTVGAGDFTIAGTGSEINSGGTITIDDPYDVTIGGSGMTAVGDISIVADNDINIDAAVNSTLAGNITMTADAGNILLSDEVRTTTTGDITMTATLGYIDDDDASNETEYVAGDTITLTAATGIGKTTSDIDTQATTIDASTTAATANSHVVIQNNTDNNVTIVNSGTAGTTSDFTFTQDGGGSVTVTSLTTTDGNVTIDVNNPVNGPGLTVTSIDAGGTTVGYGDVTLTTDNGGMVLTSVLSDDDISATASAGNITIGVVGDSGTDDITITATTGSIDEIAPGDAGVDIVGDAVNLTAQDGIGNTYSLETTITSLDASVTDVGDIAINETDDIILTDVDTVDGDITISAGGLITATDVDAGGNDGDVSLSTTAGGMILTSVLANDDITATADAGDITLGVVGDAGTDDVTITATTGSINETATEDATADITADAVVLTAQDEIGGTTAFETEATTISADATLAGDIVFTELDNNNDGITLQSIDTNDGNITITTNGGTHEAGTETTITSVKSDSGVAGAHDISITATTGDITLAGNTSDTPNIQSDNDITLTATAGSITEDSTFAVPGDSYVDIVGNKLTITAQDEIGSSSGEYDIETTIANLDASSTSAGDIIITETDAITLSDVDTANGAITIVAGGQITATDVASLTDSDTNDISLTSTGSGIEARLINAGTTAGDVTLDAQGGAITQDGDAAADVVADVLTASAAGGIDLDTTVNSVSGTASSAGTITLDETDAITLTNLSTTDGSITVTSDGNMTVTSVTAGGDTGSNDDVSLTTTTGDIIMSGDITALNDEVTLTSAANITDTTDRTTDISAANLTISANSGTVGAAGANNELDTDVDTITAAVQGDTYILENDAVTLTSVVTTNGLIDVEAGGTITTTTVTAGGSNGVTLYATAGNIADSGGAALLTAGATSYLKADNGIIGTIANHYNVDINGDLWVKAGAETDEVSAIMDGTVKSTSATERVEILLPAPPGLVILNNHLMGGENYGSGSPGGSILSRGYGFAIIEKANMFNFFYGRALSRWGYKITAPWALSEANFIDDSFLNGPPIIMDGSAIGVNVLPRELLIAPAIFQPQNYYIIRQIKK